MSGLSDDPRMSKINEVIEKIKTRGPEADEEALKQELFDAAIESFDEHIAGMIELADGRTLYVPPIRGEL